MPRRLLAVATLLLIAVLGLVALACADDDGEDTTAAPTTAAAEATPTTPPDETPGATPFAGGREPVERPAEDVPATPLLVDVEVSQQNGFDRVVFVFEGALPGYRVRYADEAISIACGSGEQTDVEGAALLEVRMAPAAAHDEAGNPTFGQQELAPGLTSILEAEQSCDFEGNVTWIVGVSRVVDVRVDNLDGPARIVVDVAHP